MGTQVGLGIGGLFTLAVMGHWRHPLVARVACVEFAVERCVDREEWWLPALDALGFRLISACTLEFFPIERFHARSAVRILGG